jgi:hypothetical protein
LSVSSKLNVMPFKINRLHMLKADKQIPFQTRNHQTVDQRNLFHNLLLQSRRKKMSTLTIWSREYWVPS